MSNNVFEEAPQQEGGGATDKIRKAARQLAYDTRYKVKQKFKDGQKTDPASLKRAYMQQLGSSSAPGPVKALAKKMLIGEEYDLFDISETLESTTSGVLGRVFVEGGGQKVEVEEIEEAADTKFTIRVKDKKTGREYYRKADRAKISELRANPNISSVEITGRKESDTYDKTGGGKKAKKDYDGDGKIESGTDEWKGSRDKAIKKAMAKEEYLDEDSRRMSNKQRTALVRSNIKSFGSNFTPPNNYDPDANRGKGEVLTRKQMEKKRRKALRSEEVIYEKEENGEKKLDVMKGKNNVKVNPTIGESIRAELDALKAQKVEEAAAAAKEAGPSPEEKMQLANKDKMLKKKIMMQKQTLQMQKQGRLPLNYSEEAKVCEKCGKSPCECDKGDTREEPTKAMLFKNKLRARGIQVAGLSLSPRNMKTYDDLGEAVANRAEYEKVAKERAPKDDKKLAYQFKDNKDRRRDLKKLARLVRHADGMKKNPAMYDSFEAEGEMTEAAEDRARDEHQMRGGMAARKDYDRPPAKKLSNKELGIKPGKTWVQKQMEKK